MRRVLHVAAVLTLLGCQAMDEMHTEPNSPPLHAGKELLRLQEQLQYHQSLLMELKTDNKDVRTDVAAVVKGLEDTAHRSIRELEDLRQILRQNQQEMGERLEKKLLLRQRWWRAKRKLRGQKREAEADGRASLQQAEALRAEILDTLAKVKRLHYLQEHLEKLTERIHGCRQTEEATVEDALHDIRDSHNEAGSPRGTTSTIHGEEAAPSKGEVTGGIRRTILCSLVTLQVLCSIVIAALRIRRWLRHDERCVNAAPHEWGHV